MPMGGRSRWQTPSMRPLRDGGSQAGARFILALGNGALRPHMATRHIGALIMDETQARQDLADMCALAEDLLHRLSKESGIEARDLLESVAGA